mgnify:CR=1 FL=1
MSNLIGSTKHARIINNVGPGAAGQTLCVVDFWIRNKWFIVFEELGKR